METFVGSRFNYTFEYQANYFVFNTLSGRMATVSKKIFDKLCMKAPFNEFENEIIQEQLIKNKFVVSQVEDEIVTAKHMINQLIYDNKLDVTIVPTEGCNFRCVYCFERHDVSLSMTDETERYIIRFFETNMKKYKSVKITWFGGEPLIEVDRVLRIMGEVNRLGKRYQIPVVANMITNGYLLDVNTFGKLIDSNIRFFEITIDGDKEYHDSLRCLANGKGTYDRIVQNLVEIQRSIPTSRFNIVIRTNVNRKNQNNYMEFVSRLKFILNGDKRFQFMKGIISNWGGESVKRVEEDLFQLEDYIVDIADSANYSVSTKGLGQLRCYAGKYHGFVITHDAKIVKCAKVGYNESNLQEKEINAIGYISKNGTLQLDEVKCAQFLEISAMGGECEKCLWMPICFASRCPIDRIKNKEIFCKIKGPNAKKNLYNEMVSSVLRGDYIAIGTE